VFTPKILRLPSSLSTTRPFSKGYYFDRAIVKGNSLTWDVKIFESLSNGLYQLNGIQFSRENISSSENEICTL
jgi:hypothetical protein